MNDPQRLLDQLLGGIQSPSGQGKGGVSPDLLKGAAVGGLAGLLLGSKTGRKLGKSAVKIGSIAALGGLAWKAFQDYQSRRQGAGEPRVLTPTAPAELAHRPSLPMMVRQSGCDSLQCIDGGKATMDDGREEANG